MAGRESVGPAPARAPSQSPPNCAAYRRDAQRHRDIEPVPVQTRQHYDEKLSDIFFRQMGILSPHVN